MSFTEVSTALACYARWDFSYGGRLAGGSVLKPREVAPILSDGRAWGSGVAALHATGSIIEGHFAIADALMEDAAEMRERGFHVDPERLVNSLDTLGPILDHYAEVAAPLHGLTRLEDQIVVGIPSRTGKRASTRYRFLAKIDGHADVAGIPAVVEYKLRESLTEVAVIEKLPQYRWYAYAYARAIRWDGPVTVYVDEALKAAPKPPRLIKAAARDSTCPVCRSLPGMPCTDLESSAVLRSYHDERKALMTVSHAVDQITTPELYEAACVKYRVEPSQDTLSALRMRRWHQRVPLTFTPAQLVEAGQELTTAARVIRDLDSGSTFPIRNGSAQNCRGCRFKGICSEPANELVVNASFERRPPKRDLPRLEAVPA